jgi:hypothetical protein
MIPRGACRTSTAIWAGAVGAVGAVGAAGVVGVVGMVDALVVVGAAGACAKTGGAAWSTSRRLPAVSKWRLHRRRALVVIVAFLSRIGSGRSIP